MKHLFKLSALAAALAFSGAASADPAETKGGIKIKTEDGRFEATVGGRIHFDGYVLDNDTDSGFGSSSLIERGGFAFRRTYLTLTGKLYGWKYKFEHDFAAQSATAPSTINGSGFRELWVSTNLGPGELTIGQFKPYRGMEELTSSNEITMIERPVTSATGIYAGRQFLMGVGYKGIVADQFGYGVHAMGLGAANTTTEGSAYGGRLYWFPMTSDGAAVHVGLSANVDDADTGSLAPTPAYGYAGRRGPVATFGTAGASNNTTSRPNTDNAQQTLALELGASFGPITLQTEYATASLDNTHFDINDPSKQLDSDVDAFYVMGSWFVTGETAVYKKDRGAFGKPKPASDGGAWELVARFESIENKDENATNGICTLTTGALPVTTPAFAVPSTTASQASAATECKATTMSVGANWYVNPNVRFMLNYYVGKADVGTAEDKPKAITLRTQLSF